MSWFSNLPIAISPKEVRNWLLIWKKFKGKLVRVWMVTAGKPNTFAYVMPTCISSHLLRDMESKFDNSFPTKYKKYLDPSNPENERMSVTGAQTIEGTIDEIIEMPFGLLLKDVAIWISPFKPVDKEHVLRNIAVEKVKTDVECMFIPVEQIIRIDFLKRKESNKKK